MTTTQGSQQLASTPLLGPNQAKNTKFGLLDRPQVNLLPAEVTNKRKLDVVKRRMVWVLLAAALVIVLCFGAAFVINAGAQQRNEDAMAQADSLNLELKRYSPVVQVINNIDDLKKSREFVLANEVNWASYVYALAAVLPEGVTLDSVGVASIGPGAELVVGVDELTTDAIGVMTFTANSPTLPDASAWIDTLESMPGLADANLQSSELQDDEGNVTYEISATVQVTDQALADRTFPDEEAADDAEVADDTASDEEPAADEEDEG